jgi:hypothetical protein
MSSAGVKRWSIAGKATVKIGECSRGGRPRGAHRAREHERGCTETEVPGGIVDAERGAWALPFGSSSKTSACLVAVSEAKWEAMEEQEQTGTSLIPLTMDHGPASSGRRPQFLSRMVQLADVINKPMQLVYSPPYHSITT